jgi:putative PIN family toxin of toxin-antitoxin system
MTPPKVVLDTNCVISALLFPSSRMAWLRQSWQAQTIRPVCSRETVLELIRVLSYPKFKLSADEQKMLIADYLPHAETIVVDPAAFGPVGLRDPDDEKFVALARAANADMVVRGDRDLLDAASMCPDVVLMTPVDFSDYLLSSARSTPSTSGL